MSFRSLDSIKNDPLILMDSHVFLLGPTAKFKSFHNATRWSLIGQHEIAQNLSAAQLYNEWLRQPNVVSTLRLAEEQERWLNRLKNWQAKIEAGEHFSGPSKQRDAYSELVDTTQQTVGLQMQKALVDRSGVQQTLEHCVRIIGDVAFSKTTSPAIDHRTDEDIVAWAFYSQIIAREPLTIITADQDIARLYLHTKYAMNDPVFGVPSGVLSAMYYNPVTIYRVKNDGRLYMDVTKRSLLVPQDYEFVRATTEVVRPLFADAFSTVPHVHRASSSRVDQKLKKAPRALIPYESGSSADISLGL